MKKNKNSLPGLIFAILFFVLAIPKFYKKEWIDGSFNLVAAIGFIFLYFSSRRRRKE